MMPMQSGETAMPSDNTRRRNIYLALAIVLFATSLMFIYGPKQMVWWMWRDAPIAAIVLTLAAIFFALRWWRTPRS
jgi:hypothetical protein